MGPPRSLASPPTAHPTRPRGGCSPTRSPIHPAQVPALPALKTPRTARSQVPHGGGVAAGRKVSAPTSRVRPASPRRADPPRSTRTSRQPCSAAGRARAPCGGEHSAPCIVRCARLAPAKSLTSPPPGASPRPPRLRVPRLALESPSRFPAFEPAPRSQVQRRRVYLRHRRRPPARAFPPPRNSPLPNLSCARKSSAADHGRRLQTPRLTRARLRPPPAQRSPRGATSRCGAEIPPVRRCRRGERDAKRPFAQGTRALSALRRRSPPTWRRPACGARATRVARSQSPAGVRAGVRATRALRRHAAPANARRAGRPYSAVGRRLPAAKTAMSTQTALNWITHRVSSESAGWAQALRSEEGALVEAPERDGSMG
ncbi:hypothetical protein B0H15DRAFT_561851 [Mycena belliarum]|uniref:Uncharacterized protein n=1 Tax=Mycena belliarum TaxID=1033014 RepID=A0AAD6TX49_9AGAR|nr:hypothetical protein B0H15DRAFT_561851 [Mycena belliae]